MTLEMYAGEVADRLAAEAVASLTRIAETIAHDVLRSYMEEGGDGVELVLRALINIRDGERERCARRCELMAKFLGGGARGTALEMVAKELRRGT